MLCVCKNKNSRKRFRYSLLLYDSYHYNFEVVSVISTNPIGSPVEGVGLQLFAHVVHLTECDCEASITRRLWLARGCFVMTKIQFNTHCVGPRQGSLGWWQQIKHGK